MQQFCRTEALIGKSAQQRLHQKHIAVFGLGGVGSSAVEALARAGIGTFTLVDCDVFDETNLNRQLFALHSTLGQRKTDVAKARIADINPDAVVETVFVRFEQASLHLFDFSKFDYVVDAIDTVTSKLLLVQSCHESGTPVISCMGTGNKFDATAFKVADVFQTTVCPLAKVMRKELKARNIASLKVVYSEELPATPHRDAATENLRKQTVGSMPFVPPVAGMILAGEVIKDMLL